MKHSPLLRYGIATLAVALVVLLKLLLDPLIAQQSPLLLMAGAVMVGAWFGGFGPGVVATLLGALAADYFFLAPVGSFTGLGAGLLPITLFVLQGLLISVLVEALHSARQRAEARALEIWRKQEELRRSEERFRWLVEGVRDYAIFMLDSAGRVTTWNKGAQRIFGYTEEEIVGEPGSILFTPEDIRGGAPERELRKAEEEGRAVDERWHVRKDGSRFWSSGFVRPIRDDAGNLRGFAKVARDITERKEVEDRVRESEERYRAVVKQSTDGIYLVDGDTRRILETNPALQNMLGYTADELGGMELHEIIAHDRKSVEANIERTLREGSRFIRERRYRRKDGSEVDVEVAASAIHYGGKRGICAAIRDITERRRAEEALRQSERVYRSVVEQAAENIFLVDVETRRILEANAAFYHSLGYAPEELDEVTLYDVVAHDRESIDLNVQRIVQEGQRSIGERKYRRKDGSLIAVEVSASAIFYGGRETMCIVAHDVTERKQVEENLRQSLGVLLALREAGQVLGSTLESEEVVSRLLEIMRGVSNLTAAVISVRDQGGSVHIWRSAGLQGLWRRARFAPEAAAARRAALEDGEQRLFRLRHPELRSEQLVGLCLPLRSKDRILGVLEAYGPESLAESHSLDILGSLSNQAASALENAQLYEELGEREHRLQDLVGKLLRAQEEERRLVAYEVHDGLAQVATAAHQHLQAFAERHTPTAEKGRRDLDRILRLVRATVSDARRIIADLRPTALDDLGLAATISQEVERLREEGYQVDYQEELGEGRLPVAAETSLFRVAQEALTNVRKHAQTQRVRIELRRREGEVRLEVQDYGRGIDPTAASAESGPGARVGLAGMRERVSMLGGKLEIHSQPDEGTSVVATVHLTQVP